MCGGVWGDTLRWLEVAIDRKRIASGTVLLKIKQNHEHEQSE